MQRRRHLSALPLVAAALLGASACSGPPGGQEAPFVWTIEIADLPDALLAVWTSRPEQVIAVGGDDAGLVLEWNGASWTAPPLPPGTGVLWWTWATADASVAFAVGEQGTILRRIGGGAWTRDDLSAVVDPRVTFYGVWGSSATDVWAVGGSLTPGFTPGAILHWDGGGWTSHTGPVVDEHLLFKVWGQAADDVWAVGLGGAALHYDGVAWQATDTNSEARLVAVMGRASDEVYAVGGDGNGLILHWNGAAWSQFDTVSILEPLAGVWTAPGRPLYVGGNRGQLHRYSAGAGGRADPLRITSAWPIDDVDFHSLAGWDGGVLAVGADLFVDGGEPRRGTLAAHGASFPGAPPAGVDAGVRDAAPIDATAADAGVDAMPPDARWPANGEPCEFNPMTGYRCADGFTCWLLLVTDVPICTQNCDAVDDCAAYGAGACCRPPGPQTLETVCIPGMYQECS